ncbi:MAG: hypothetical protein RIC03_02855 [Cyclobacteriaceae bacterium]
MSRLYPLKKSIGRKIMAKPELPTMISVKATSKYMNFKKMPTSQVERKTMPIAYVNLLNNMISTFIGEK